MNVTGDGDWIKKKMLSMFSDVTAEIFHVTPAAKLNDSPECYQLLSRQLTEYIVRKNLLALITVLYILIYKETQ